MLTKTIIDKIEALERDNALLKSQVRHLNSIKSISHDDILKLICDKIPKDKKKSISVNDIAELINKIVTVKFVNKLYGKNNG